MLNKQVLKKRIIQALTAMYEKNPGMNSEIDSYNFGIHDSIKKIKEIL